MNEGQSKLTFVFLAIHSLFANMSLDEFKELDSRLHLAAHIYEHHDYYHYFDPRVAMKRAIAQCEEYLRK